MRAAVLALISVSLSTAAGAQTTRIAAVTTDEVRSWNARVEGLLRDGSLRERQLRDDTLIPGRTHQRLAQFYRGLPVFGGEIVRQLNGSLTVSVFGTLYEGIAVDPQPALSAAQAKAAVEALAGQSQGPARVPELMVLPKPEGGYALSYRLRAYGQGDIKVYFIDARSGALAWSYSDLQTASAVGSATGVLGDTKKISSSSGSGTYTASDELRPPSLRTFDLKGNIFRTLDFLNGFIDFDDSDLARDSDNTWTDGPNGDAHIYAGYVYDYYFKRFGRRGLDNNNIGLRSIVHPVNREDIFNYPNFIIGIFYLNAFYAGDGIMVYGEGLPVGLTVRGQAWNYLAGGFDVVAHELTHGVTGFTSNLTYVGESGALNEAFSDIMGTSMEFFYQPPGDGPLKADYLIGEDVVTPGGLRSLKDPRAYGDPDNFSVRYTGSADNGGVHTNSGIANQAFYLAIEGGTNRTSGISVQGIGATNREQMEKVFYRAFTQLLTPSANFATARAATIQAARDLYGGGSGPERAVSQAWTAVGVN